MSEKISEIKKKFEAASENELPSLIKEYETDGRKGVDNLIAAANRKIQAL